MVTMRLWTLIAPIYDIITASSHPPLFIFMVRASEHDRLTFLISKLSMTPTLLHLKEFVKLLRFREQSISANIERFSPHLARVFIQLKINNSS